MENEVVVMVSTHDRPTELLITLMSLWQQSFKDFDILIVDDASDPANDTNDLYLKMVERLEEDGQNVIYKYFDENKGIAHNRAKVLPMLKKYKYVLDLNDDHWLEPDVLFLLKSFLDKNEDVGAVGTATPFFFSKLTERVEQYVSGFKINTATANMYNGEKNIHLERHVDKVFIDGRGQQIIEPIECDHISQFMYRPELVSELPTNYSVLGFTEETDLSLRIRKAGKRLFFLPNAINWHFQSGNGGIRKIYGMKKKEMIQADWKLFIENWWGWLNEN